MRANWMRIAMGLAVLSITAAAGASELKIQVNGPVAMTSMKFACDAQGAKMGLPAGTFTVVYMNETGNTGGVENHLAIVPIHGNSLIFSNVMSGSGARYAAGAYIWWDAAGRSVSLSSDSLAGKMRSECHRVAK